MPSWNARPDHVGENGLTKPYLSSWYIHAGTNTGQLMHNLDRHKSAEVGWVIAKTIQGLKWKIRKHQKKVS
eukprot:10357085-Ditylum_brightwellii.AAC.1